MQITRMFIVVGYFFFAGFAFAAPPGFVKTMIPLDAPPVGLAYSADGTLFALEGAPFGTNEATLRLIQPNGSFGASFTIAGDDTANFFVGAMTYDPIDGHVLITDNTADGRLYAIDSLGMKHTIGLGLAGVAGVAVRSTGEIFVSTAPFGNPGQVLHVDRATGATTPVLGDLGYGAGLAFDGSGNLVVQDTNTTTFAGRLQRLPMTVSGGTLTIGTPEPLLDGMQSSAGVLLTNDNQIFTTGSGGLFRVDEVPLVETPFESNGNPFQFSTAIAFDPGSQPFDGFSGPGGGRLAYMADFSSLTTSDNFVTILMPAEPGDYNGDGQVNAADYDVWRAAFGTNNLSADGNRDGIIDAADYVAWRDNFDVDADAHSALNLSVPEPFSASLLLMASLCIIAGKLRQKTLVRNAG